MNRYNIFAKGQYLMVEITPVLNDSIEIKEPREKPMIGEKPQNSIFAVPLNSTIQFIKDSNPKSRGEIGSILCVYNNVTLCSIDRYYDETLFTGQLPITSTVKFENLDDIDKIEIENVELPEKYSEVEANEFYFNDENTDFEKIKDIFYSFTNVIIMQPKEKN
jgi:hypothetical protein